MKTKEQRVSELYSSGLVDKIKQLFANRNDISEEYYVLMADYIDSMDEIKEQMIINPAEIARKMPELVKNISETNLRGIYGITDDGRIQIEQSLSYENKKLYFFHELTHALQTFYKNGREQCGFYNGHDGMFLTEGATQYTAEMLYHVSNGTDLEYRQQDGTVRGAENRTPYSPLSEYQYNGNILDLLAKSIDLPLPQVLALAYKEDGREVLKSLYESMDGNQGKFDELMYNLEKIYSIDKLIIFGYSEHLQNQNPELFNMSNDEHTPFRANFDTYHELMNKVERELVANYMNNHKEDEILQNYNEIAQFLTTPELKDNFLAAVQQLGQDLQQQKFTLKQKVAQFLQKNNIFMNLSFVKNFVQNQLDVLPPAQQENVSKKQENFKNFKNQLTNFGAYRNLPKIQRMVDPQKIEEMRRKMEQGEKNNKDNEK